MPAAHILAANQQSADTAGQTRSGADNHQTAAPAPTQVSEILHGDLNLSGLLAGGVHPETAILELPVTALEKATDSIVGRLGGLVPARGSVVQPGPAGQANAARSILGENLARLADAFKKQPADA